MMPVPQSWYARKSRISVPVPISTRPDQRRSLPLRAPGVAQPPHGTVPPGRYNAPMPVSKSKRRRYQPPPKPKHPPSAAWVPVLFFALLGLGVVVILARYILSGSVGFFDKDYMIWIGLLLIAVAFGVATQWH